MAALAGEAKNEKPRIPMQASIRISARTGLRQERSDFMGMK
jgi:hypothetical protein